MTTTLRDPDLRRLQRRTVRTLATAQVFSGLGNGSTIALGSILAVELSGAESLAGVATTAMTLGTAVSAIPLSQLALARGRRVALAAGLGGAVAGTMFMLVAVLARSFPALLVGAFLVGLASAVNLQARFAVTDLAAPQHRGRDLSLVVWAITVGAVLGPNMVGPGAVLAGWLHLPAQAGPFVISAAGMITGGTLVWARLRPDPLTTRRALDTAPGAAAPGPPPVASWRTGWRYVRRHPSALAAVLAVVAAHGVMVAVMAMTPLHLQHEAGAHAHHPDTITLIGFTISLHIAGMFALSPVMGWMADRAGTRVGVLVGLVGLLAAVTLTGLGHHNVPAITVGLVLLGLGWSAATVSGSTLLVEALAPQEEVPAQGFSDALMSLAGAGGSAVAGVLMGAIDYRGVSVVSLAVVFLAGMGFIALARRTPVPA